MTFIPFPRTPSKLSQKGSDALRRRPHVNENDSPPQRPTSFRNGVRRASCVWGTFLIVANSFAPVWFCVCLADDGPHHRPIDREPAASQAEWVWEDGTDRMGESAVVIERTFELSEPCDRAMLQIVADFAAIRVEINGNPLFARDAYGAPLHVDVARFLIPGSNSLLINALGVTGPSAIAAALECFDGKTRSAVILSDQTCKDGQGQPVLQLGHVGSARWSLERLSEISPFDEYNQWKEALNSDQQLQDSESEAKLSPLPPGFEIIKVRQATPEEGSWISLAFDPQGRLMIAREDKGILCLTLSDDRDRVAKSELINDALGEVRGLVWHKDALFAHANRDKALYRLRRNVHDDRWAAAESLFATEGGTGHGRNDLVIGADGALHAIVGDDVLVPDSSPRRARPEASAKHELGHWARLDLNADGATWQAMNRGLRNPYGIDFNRDGEAFTYDADNEGDVGLSYYRPNRINHLVSGANYGWHQDRDQCRSMPVYAPDSWPSTLDLGRGSPTAVKFATNTGFPAPWRHALFVLDWAYGRIIAIELLPHGASYVGSATLFLQGRPLNVTDLEFGPDGAMWFITGGRKTASALYRVRYVNHASPDATPHGKQTTARMVYSAQARKIRGELEAFHGRIDPQAIPLGAAHLGSDDPWIRGAARVALEWQPVAMWRSYTKNAPCNLEGLTWLMALARAGSNEDRQAVSRQVSAFLDGAALSELSEIERLTLLRIHELCGVPTDPAVKQQCLDQASALAVRDSVPVARELARWLVSLQAPQAVAFSLERLASTSEQPERLHYLEVLSDAKVGWDEEQQVVFFTALAHAKRFSNGDRFMPPFFDAISHNALLNVDRKDQRDLFSKMLSSNPKTEPIVTPRRPIIRQWTMADVLGRDRATPSRTPNLARGRDLYSVAQCAKCHVCGSIGHPIGPDLTTVGRRFSRREVMHSIIEPSSVIAEAYRNWVIIHNDGSVTTGRVIQNDFRESKLILAVNEATSPVRKTVDKADIESWTESPVSPMPSGLLDTLDHDEIEDLVAFILAQGRVHSPVSN